MYEECVLGLTILFAIPLFGAIKNIIKRKSFNILIFLRSFMIYIIIYSLVYLCFDYPLELNIINSMFLSLSERWSMFIYKICYSYITKNYEKKKYKYYQKYQTELSENSLNKISDLDMENKFV